MRYSVDPLAYIHARSAGGAFTAAETYDFANSANGTMGFTGNFSRVNPGVLQSTNVGPTSPTTKVLTSPSFLAPNSITNIQFGFDVAGNADVTGYTVEFLYDCPSGICAVTVCSAPATTLNGTVNFSVAAPAQIIGQRFAIRITYTVSGTTNQNITIDNFRTNVGASAIVLPVLLVIS